MSKTKKKLQIGKTLLHIVTIMASSALIGIGINLFYLPQDLVGGGAAAIGILVHAVTGFNLSLFLLIINIPIFIMGLILIDRHFFFNSLLGMLSMTAAIELFSILPPISDDIFCCSLAGGILMGTGGGLLFRNNASGGGFDIVFRIFHKYFSIPIGTSSVITNTIILLAASYFLSVNVAIYSIVAIFISSRMVNYIVDGIDYKCSVTIVSEKSDEIAKVLIDEFSHGVTLVSGKGGYSNKPLTLIQCTITPYQLPTLKKLVLEIDKLSFMTVSESTAVIGGTFKNNSID